MNKMNVQKNVYIALLLGLGEFGLANQARADFDLSWYTIDGGGGMSSTGVGYEVSGTIAQCDAGPGTAGMADASGTWTLVGGFWPGTAEAAVTVPPRHPVTWQSIRNHSGVGDLAINLNSTATGNAPVATGGPSVETRGTAATGGVGITRIQVVFNDTATAPNLSAITVTGYTTTYPGGVPTLGPATSRPPVSAVMVNTTTMEMTFTPALPDQSCYIVTLGANAIAEGLTGDLNVVVRVLNGDANLSGTISNSDIVLTKSKFTSNPPNGAVADSVNQIFDYNLSGLVNNSDIVYCKAQFTQAAGVTKSALCP